MIPLCQFSEIARAGDIMCSAEHPILIYKFKLPQVQIEFKISRFDCMYFPITPTKISIVFISHGGTVIERLPVVREVVEFIPCKVSPDSLSS